MQFDFGQNWKDFAQTALTPERARQARGDFARLMQDIPLLGKRFLDIGFGQGLGLLCAVEMGATGVGCDINPKCREALERSATLFPAVRPGEIPLVVGSILDEATVARLAAKGNADGGYDVVHSWGVLHHTGDMRRAIRHAASLVTPGGHFVIAIYNRHWSSRAWLTIKWVYCKSPRWLQRAMIALLYPVIWVAKLVVTRKDPKKKERGMDFYYDVVDWVGGYPYEYAGPGEITALVAPLGFECLRVAPAKVPTGCNEFVFRRSRVAS
jgi:SAM-dependent methyltransferase